MREVMVVIDFDEMLTTRASGTNLLCASSNCRFESPMVIACLA